MADIAESPVSADITTPKKTMKKAKVTRVKASHPTTSVMVNNAIKNLKERGGSSLQAIKKYVSSTYKVDAEKLAPFIKKCIKASVVSGAFVQTKGKGASGSFKLATTAVSKKTPTVAEKKKATKPAAKSPAKLKTKPVAKTVVTAKKAPAKKAVAKPKRTAVAAKKLAVKPKSPPKAKQIVKTPVKKSPKAKTAKAKSPAKSKRTAPKRK